MHNEHSLESLLAKQAIQELVLRYCRAVDRKDYDALPALYHSDATEDHGAMFQGSAADYIRWLPSQLDNMLLTVHSVSNHLIVLQGECAVGEVYCQAYHRYRGPQGEEELLVGGRYLDRYRRCNGEWRFSNRQIVTDWNERRPSRSEFRSALFAGTAVGAALPDDVSAQLFRGLD